LELSVENSIGQAQVAKFSEAILSVALQMFLRFRAANLERLIRFFDQAFKKPFQVGGGLVAAVFNDMGFLSERERVQSLGKRLAAIGTEHHDLAPVIGILRASS